MPVDPLEPILAHAATETHLLHRAELETVSRVISRHDPDEFIYAVTRVCALSWEGDRPRPEGYLEIHSQHWWVDLSVPDTRHKLLIVVAAAALVDALDLTLSTTWVARVLCTAISIESVAVIGTELWIRLHRHAEPRLPDHLEKDIHPSDYAEFIQAITNAADTEHRYAGGTVCFTPSPT
jgi:hypothetical protein